MSLIHGKQIRSGSIDPSRLSFTINTGSSKPTFLNKGMPALLTTADFQLACSGALGPIAAGSYPEINVNGVQQELGDATKTKDCYFSLDNGTTPLSGSQLVSGSLLYWVGSVAGFELAPSDKIDFNYNV